MAKKPTEVVIIEVDEKSAVKQKIAKIKDAVSKQIAVILNLNKLNNTAKEEKIFRFIKDNSEAVVERLLALRDETNCIFLKGNHEQLFLKALKTLSEEDVANCMVNGGAETLKQYLLMKKNNIDKFREHMIFFKNLKDYYATDEFIFVHAGLSPFKHILEKTEDDFLWIREEFLDNKINVSQKIIFGHTVFDEPFVQDNKIGINTCCGIDENAPLTAYICNENKFVQSD